MQALLMDLSKAFDCVPYGLLIAKMHAYGLSTNACKFMSSYLSDRYQRVKISNVKRSWMPSAKRNSTRAPALVLFFSIYL